MSTQSKTSNERKQSEQELTYAIYSLDSIIAECERLKRNGFDKADLAGLAECIRTNCEPVSK